MQATELRIGNWVWEHMTDDYIQIDGTDQIHHAANYKPIPLTEEWLIKFGFEKEGDSFIILKGYLYLRGGQLEIAGKDACSEYQCFYAPCEYVHQLQNLHHALTGEELICK